MTTLIKASKYIHILYYISAFAAYLDFILMMLAPDFQMGIAGTGCLLATIFGLISTFLLIKEKSFIKLIINICIPIGIILIILFGPGV